MRAPSPGCSLSGMWLLCSCTVTLPGTVDPPAASTSVDTAVSVDSAPDSPPVDSGDTGDTSAHDSVDTGVPADTGFPVDTAFPVDTGWPTLSCDTGAVLPAAGYGVDTGACGENTTLTAGLAEIPPSDDSACPWSVPADTATPASGCPAAPDTGWTPTADSGCIAQAESIDGEHVWTRIFDAAGREVAYESDDFVAIYTYDDAGNLLLVDESYGSLTWQYVYTYTFDDAGHPLRVEIQENGALTDTVEYSYDADGRLATACGDGYGETYTWTDAGQLASYGFDGADPDGTDGGGWFTYVIDYAYDDEGRTTGRYYHWIYDSWGDEDDRAYAWSYDADGNPTARYVSTACGPPAEDRALTFTYDASCGVTVTGYTYGRYREFDADGRLVANGSTYSHDTYAYADVDCPCGEGP